MIHKIAKATPEIAKGVFVAWNAEVAGNVSIDTGSSVWFSATIRGDSAKIIIGKNVSIQDNAVIHVDFDKPVIVHDNVTVGHGAMLHSCTVGAGTTVGMGAIVLDDAKIGENSMVAAGSVVPPGKEFPPNSMIMGSPAKVTRALRPEEIESMRANALHYVELGERAFSDYQEL